MTLGEIAPSWGLGPTAGSGERGTGSHRAGCLYQSFFLILNYPSSVWGLFGYVSTSKALVIHPVFICLRAMSMKDHNVLPVFTELKDLRSDPMLPVTRASRLIESENGETLAFYQDI
jgi:hypothetical protein